MLRILVWKQENPPDDDQGGTQLEGVALNCVKISGRFMGDAQTSKCQETAKTTFSKDIQDISACTNFP